MTYGKNDILAFGQMLSVRNAVLFGFCGAIETGWVTMPHPGKQFAKRGSVERECVGSGPVRLLDEARSGVPDGEVAVVGLPGAKRGERALAGSKRPRSFPFACEEAAPRNATGTAPYCQVKPKLAEAARVGQA